MSVETGPFAIDARGVSRRFGAFVAVDQVDVRIGHGEVFGLLGANGAGKTTTIRMLCGTLAPSAGEIYVGGVNMVHRARRARSRIGYVTQRFTLYGDLSVAENLELQAGLYGVRGERAGTRLAWALDCLDIGHVRDIRAGSLSLGYQRRLAVAAALLHEPDVLFLDEPTSGLDPLARQQLWELVYELAAKGIGVLISTHYIDEALFCDRLALMDRGRVILEGSPADLLQVPLPTPMIEIQTQDHTTMLPWLSARNDIREIIPRARALRIRLNPGIDAEGVLRAVRDEASRYGVAAEGVRRAEPELEDVFVSVLERTGAQ